MGWKWSAFFIHTINSYAGFIILLSDCSLFDINQQVYERCNRPQKEQWRSYKCYLHKTSYCCYNPLMLILETFPWFQWGLWNTALYNSQDFILFLILKHFQWSWACVCMEKVRGNQSVSTCTWQDCKLWFICPHFGESLGLPPFAPLAAETYYFQTNQLGSIAGKWPWNPYK